MQGGKKMATKIMNQMRHNKVITLLAIIGAVYFFLKYLSPLLSPILVAMLFLTIFGPTLKKMQKKLHINRQIGAVILLLIALIVTGLLLWILFSWIVGSLPQWMGRLDTMEQQMSGILSDVCVTIGKTIGIDSGYLEETLLGYLEKGINYLQEDGFPGILSQSLSYVRGIVSVIGFLVTFLIASVLLAKDYDKIMNDLLDREECHVLLEVICGIIRYIATFVKAQLLIMGAIGALCAFVLAIVGIENGALWGILCGLLDALPFIGTGIILVPLTIVQLVYGRVGQAVVCLILYACCAFLREMLEPKLIGNRIGVSPIAVLTSVYAGIRLFGILGIIKGPLGFMIVYQTWKSIKKRWSLEENRQ